MQTSFTLQQLADPDIAESEKILRACVHCGFCTATCPTYVLDGNELDSPRGRIYLIKDMLEHDRAASAEVTRHIDRCLSCLSCMTTCPSGVHYMHLVDHARAHIERTYSRPLGDRLVRAMLAKLMPYPGRFRIALMAALFAKPFAPVASALGLKRLAAMLGLSSWHWPHKPPQPQTFPAASPRQAATSPRQAATSPRQAASQRQARVALLPGCVNDLLAPAINAAAVSVLTRHGVEVVLPEGLGCCGSLVHHMGREAEALAQARANIDAFLAIEPLDAIVITASGCGTTMKDYGFMLRHDPHYAARAQRVATLTKDITEYLFDMILEPDSGGHSFGVDGPNQPANGASAEPNPTGLAVAYHAACSLQHGQRITRQPKELLTRLGFVVRDIPDGHLCCGSAGTYNILQSDIARRLRDLKVGTIERLRPDVIAAGNLGCITQIATGTEVPVVHTIELIDWATGGQCPQVLLTHRPLAAVRRATAAS